MYYLLSPKYSAIAGQFRVQSLHEKFDISVGSGLEGMACATSSNTAGDSDVSCTCRHSSASVTCVKTVFPRSTLSLSSSQAAGGGVVSCRLSSPLTVHLCNTPAGMCCKNLPYQNDRVSDEDSAVACSKQSFTACMTSVQRDLQSSFLRSISVVNFCGQFVGQSTVGELIDPEVSQKFEDPVIGLCRCGCAVCW